MPEGVVEIFNKDFVKSKRCLPEDIGELLSLFHKTVFNNSSDVWFGYTEDTVVVRGFNKLFWTKEIHESFCEEFNLILYAHDIVDSYSPAGYECESNWIYIPRPANEKYAEMLSININEVV
ncbi:MAG: hypothetical protein IJJ47_10230 [Methanosphaera sp.]|nr:hypothetical protein [Methanosphaera sp.]